MLSRLRNFKGVASTEVRVGKRVVMTRGRHGDIATLVIPSTNGHDFISVEIDPDRRVVRTQSGLVLDRTTFRFMREFWGALLLADDPEVLALMLGLDSGEAGLFDRESVELFA